MLGAGRVEPLCSRPWLDLNVEPDGRLSPCCVLEKSGASGPRFSETAPERYFASAELAELKQALASGERPAACQACWRDEAAGGWSVRREGAVDGVPYEEVHLKISNVCTLRCRMCSPSSSTAWISEEARATHRLYPALAARSRPLDLARDGALARLWPIIERARSLRVTGGEPFSSPGFLTLLDGLEERRLPERQRFSFVTNLTSLELHGVDFVERLGRFPSLWAILSADGAGAAVEYSRTGLSWPRFVEHLERVRGWPGVVHCVVHVYSLLSIPDLVEVAWRAGKRVHYAVPFDDVVSVQLLGPAERELVIDRYEAACDRLLAAGVPRSAIADMWRATVGLLLRGTLAGDAAARFRRLNDELDLRRGTSFSETFPELASWYEALPP